MTHTVVDATTPEQSERAQNATEPTPGSRPRPGLPGRLFTYLPRTRLAASSWLRRGITVAALGLLLTAGGGLQPLFSARSASAATFVETELPLVDPLDPLGEEVPFPAERPEVPQMRADVPVYIETTGQLLQGAFLSYYMTHPEIGDPISPMIERDGHWMQWFTYARLQLPIDGDLSDPNLISLGLIGSEVRGSTGYMQQLPAFRPVPAPAPESGSYYFSVTGHTVSGAMQEVYDLPGHDDLLGQPLSEEFQIGGVTWQMFERGAVTWEPDTDPVLRPMGVTNAALHGIDTTPQMQPWAVDLYSPDEPVRMSEAFAGERWIEVNLTTFTMTLWVGDYPVLETLVVTGSQFSPTVVGEHAIYLKNEIQSLSGIGWSGEPYFEADVPDVMYFYTDFAIHGTTWRTTYGYSDSQGCVIPPNEVADLLFEWADYGTRVSVHYGDYYVDPYTYYGEVAAIPEDMTVYEEYEEEVVPVE